MDDVVQYDAFAETFGKSRISMKWPELDDLVGDFFASHSTDHLRLLDVGCGNGRLLHHIIDHPSFSIDFTDRVDDFVGIDMSQPLLDQACERSIFRPFDDVVSWLQGDMRDIALFLSPQFFDGVFFVASFHHLFTFSERVDVLKQVTTFLHPGGTVSLLNWNLESPLHSKYQSACTHRYEDGSSDYTIKIGAHTRYYHSFSPDEWRNIAQAAGLQIVRMDFSGRNSVTVLRRADCIISHLL